MTKQRLHEGGLKTQCPPGGRRIPDWAGPLLVPCAFHTLKQVHPDSVTDMKVCVDAMENIMLPVRHLHRGTHSALQSTQWHPDCY